MIGVLAYREMPKEKQAELVRILKAHPRFEKDFELPSKVKNAVAQKRAAEAAVSLAGVWGR